MSVRETAGEPRAFSSLWWLPLAAAMVGADYLTGPYLQFPFLYTLPVGLAAWFHGLRWSLPLAVVLPLARLVYTPLWQVPGVVYQPYLNAGIRILVLGIIAVLTARVAAQSRALRHEVRRLEALLPICSHCKQIRDESEEWVQLERYFAARTGARFTHGICPECLQRHYPGFAAADDEEGGG